MIAPADPAPRKRHALRVVGIVVLAILCLPVTCALLIASINAGRR